MQWTLDDARRLAAEQLSGLGARWVHSRAVGATAEHLVSQLNLDEVVACAAWLHDVGYAESAVQTDLHALDGARLLASLDAPAELVSLVAYHSGAEYEAEERGLSADLGRFDRPRQVNLDALILADMTTSPAGVPTSVEDRLDEIMNRYPPAHPVHRAVLRSRGYLAECAARAESRHVVSR